MNAQDDPSVWNCWYVVGSPIDIRRRNLTTTRLLGHQIDLTIHKTWISVECEGRPLPVTERLGYIWTTLGEPDGPPQTLLEYYEIDRVVMNIWSTPLKCSGLRIVDNVIDNAHFPFVHPGILGDQDHFDITCGQTHVDDAGTLWSTSQKAWLPIAQSIAEYTYRIADPYSVILYIHRPETPGRYDFLGIFAQPLDEENFVAHKMLAWVAEDWMDAKQLKSDQQWISAQDKYVLERHISKKLPLGDQETSVPVDATSMAYRKWLGARGVRYGAIV
ncbi:hypothetical protein LCGC14_1559640 [marine sediment metagenome]|uniref:Vanillate O-demethylase oxygenase-like C-terminal catalytic domain-containing protein n=1 Tax=marine sediment metagenome TaxID=412755 RepID=A0A0F9J8W3_9ZZZZ